MNKCKIYCSNYSCPWNSCYKPAESESCGERNDYLVCSCARYVDVPMKIVNVGGMTEGEFQADAITLLESIAGSLNGISQTLDECCGSASADPCNGCNGFNAYDTSNAPCGSYNHRRCGRCR